MQNRELILFVGHGKTGTTYAQGLLAHNADRLAARGIHYPLPPARLGEPQDPREQAQDVRGNHDILSRQGDMPIAPEAPRIVLHSEHFFEPLTEPDHPMFRQLQRFCSVNAITRVRTVMMVRDPIDFAVSRAAQNVGRSDGSVERHLAGTGPQGRFAQIRSYLEEGLDLPGFSIEAYNYSRWSTVLKQLLADILGVGEDVLADAGGRMSNRSLRAPEFAFLKAMSPEGSQSATRMKLGFKTSVPVPAVGYHVQSLDWQRQYIERNAAEIEAINARLPEAEKLRIAYRDPTEGAGPFLIDEEWFAATGRLVGKLLDENAFHLIAAQVQIALLTASRAILTDDMDEVAQQLPVAERHLAILARLDARGKAQAEAMTQTLEQMKAHLKARSLTS
jgi:hypothetical protein